MNKIIDLVATNFPTLPFELLELFQMEREGTGLKKKNVGEFYKRHLTTNKQFPIPPVLVNICDLLVSHGYLSPLTKGGTMGMENSYIPNVPGVISNYSGTNLEEFKDHITCLVFGFSYIFEQYKNSTLPICHIKENGDKTIGTGFFYKDNLVTARHCIEGAKKISIRGLSAADLSSSKFFYHPKEGIDLAFIKLPTNDTAIKAFSRLARGNILDLVITMGYPNIPGFHTIQTVEQAQISSRLTVTKGAISGMGKQYLSNAELILITAKIRGGNSGGPVLNADGAVIGVAVQVPHGEGNYDDLGYGTVVPSEFIDEMIHSEEKLPDAVVFEDFE